MVKLNGLPKLSKKHFFIGTGLIVFALALAPTYYYYNQYQKAQKALANPTLAAEEETKALIEKVGKLIALPTDESPTIATVSDKAKLQDQAFFAKAENADKVLIYTNQKKAILYRPSLHKIIDFSLFNF